MPHRTGALRGERGEKELHDFVEARQQALWHAARLLGGYEAAKRVDDLVERLRLEAIPTRATLLVAQRLLDLLTLKNVHDPLRVEAACFAVISPEDPAIDEICLLSDGLQQAIGESTRPTHRFAA